MVAVVRSVARRLPDYPAVGRDGLVNVALLALHRNGTRYKTMPKALMARIAHGAMVDELRKMKLVGRNGWVPPRSTPLEIETEGGDPLDNVELPAVYEEDPTDAVAILEVLTETERHLVLRVLQGYNNKEIGKELGVSESRISQLMESARRRIVADAARTRRAEAVRRRVQP
jgi:RNA polymerase sigma factor (sigma-70 family)